MKSLRAHQPPPPRPTGAAFLLAQLGAHAADRFAESDPSAAGTILETITPAAKEPEKLLDKKQEIWERASAAHADDPDIASQLAIVYEGKNQLEKCEKLLAPFVQKLGTREGARILGHIYTTQNKLEEAHSLLQPYLEGRLDKLHAAEKVYEGTRLSLGDKVWNDVSSRRDQNFPMQRFNNATEAQKQVIAGEYIYEKTKNDPTLIAAHQALVKELAVVPVGPRRRVGELVPA